MKVRRQRVNTGGRQRQDTDPHINRNTEINTLLCQCNVFEQTIHNIQMLILTITSFQAPDWAKKKNISDKLQQIFFSGQKHSYLLINKRTESNTEVGDIRTNWHKQQKLKTIFQLQYLSLVAKSKWVHILCKFSQEAYKFFSCRNLLWHPKFAPDY